MIVDDKCNNHEGEGKFFFFHLYILSNHMNLDVVDEERDNHKGGFFFDLYIIYLNL